jgi:hypothetical protein
MKTFQHELEEALRVSLAARLSDSDMHPCREKLIACYAAMLQGAREAKGTERTKELEAAMQASKTVIPLLGPLGGELEKEHAIAKEYFSEIKAAEEREIERKAKDIPEIEVPDEFKCAISHSIMRDPVVAADGHSYDRESIEEYFQRNAIAKSPMTQEPLKNKKLVPNSALKKLIRGYEADIHKNLVDLNEQKELARKISSNRHREEEDMLRNRNQALEEQLMTLHSCSGNKSALRKRASWSSGLSLALRLAAAAAVPILGLRLLSAWKR